MKRDLVTEINAVKRLSLIFYTRRAIYLEGTQASRFNLVVSKAEERDAD
jgi:hypothetical protein